MAKLSSELPGRTHSLFSEIAKRSASESGGDPLKRIELMQGYMSQATPGLLEATMGEVGRRQRKEVSRAGQEAQTARMVDVGKEQLDMNRRIQKEAKETAKQAALVSAGATLLGKMATVGIDKLRASNKAKAKDAAGEVASEALLKTLGAAEQQAPAAPPVWDEKLDPRSPEAAKFVVDKFFGGDMGRYDQWWTSLRGEKPTDWRTAFGMLVRQQYMNPKIPQRRPVARIDGSVGGVNRPRDSVNDFGLV